MIEKQRNDPLKRMEALAAHKNFREELLNLLNKYTIQMKLKPEELLAVASNTVGQILAHQDARAFSKEAFLVIVMKNIEHGNLEAVREIEAGLKIIEKEAGKPQ